MNHALKKIKARLSFTEILYLIFFISLICAFRAVTSICTGLILAAGIIQHKPSLKSLFSRDPGTQFAAGCILYFLLQIISLFYTHHMPDAWNDIRLKSGLVFLPLAIICSGYMNWESIQRLLFYYCVLLFAASFFLLCMALNEYLQTHSIPSFFYHALVSPFRYHAVYFSILVFVALVFLLENLISGNTVFNKLIIVSLVVFFSFVLLLLASKLVISVYLVYLIYFLIIRAKRNKPVRFLAYGAILLITSLSVYALLERNPVSDRFRDIVHGNINLVQRDRFSPSVYFNGVQFRLLEWKFVPEILNENHGWWTGVSAGDAQTLLNQKYLSKKMYTGAPGRVGHGYLEYNTHSQFLESLLQNGIPGLLIFILICFSLLKIAWQSKKRFVSLTILLLLVYAFIESLFQEQYGIVIFCFFPLFITQDYREKPIINLKS
ncbi:MAG: hypothetical protein JWM28_1224 [Chitinophagaceae bacterium]|nr:hypothetical protein [Chitinophagaceae bacterium]